MDNPPVVRRATLNDVAAIARIHVDVWRSAYAGLLPRSVLDALSYAGRETQWREWLDDPAEAFHAFVADDDAGVAGFAACGRNREPVEGFPGELGAFYVRDDAQGRGFGRALFEAARSDLEMRGLLPFLLWVIAGNERAVRFYESLGGRRFVEQPADVRGAQIVEYGYAFGER